MRKINIKIKNKFVLWMLILLELVCIFCIYVVKGQIAPWVWTTCIFIFSPIASIIIIFQIVMILIKIVKKKCIRFNLIYIFVLIFLAYPITIFFGVSILKYPTDELSKDTINMTVPVENSILFGGKDYKTHAVWASECYAYDILKEPYGIKSNDLNDYGIYLEDIHSPVSGIVIDLEESEEDIKPNTENFSSSLGNYIFMKIEKNNTYLILAHLEKDSIDVSVGDYVNRGTVIAKVGNSGTTSEPHLHIQHQKNNPMELKIPICAEGLPIKFSGKFNLFDFE
jgi:hypothetical protein